jgi:hypothetical protein
MALRRGRCGIEDAPVLEENNSSALPPRDDQKRNLSSFIISIHALAWV